MKLERGMPAPDFELFDGDGNEWRLAELKGQKVILYFYPADDTPGCTKEACDFRDSKERFEKAGYVVLGVSSQTRDSHQAFAKKFDLNFPLLIDDDLTVAERYDVKRDEPRFYKDIPIHVRRSTFVIDEDGNIAEALYDVDAGVHVEDLKQKIA